MSLLNFEVNDGIAIVTINDPKRRNIISGALVDEIISAFAIIEKDEHIKAVIVTGAAPAFCAGADLQDLSDAREGDGTGIKKVYEGFMTIARCPLPTIAAVNGAAVGAGMNLATACDIRIAAKSAVFDTRFMQLGLHPGGGHTWMLQRAFGWQNSIATLLLGQKLTGDDAVTKGLAWACVEDEKLLETAKALASKTASYPRDLLIRTKQSLIDTAAINDHKAAVDYEYTPQMWSVQQPAFAQLIESMQKNIGQKR